jgi:chorismate mutase/prephenate dehydratase
MNNERTPPFLDGQSRSGVLKELRAEIDRVDGALLEALVNRVRLAAEIGAHKGTHGAVVFDPGREAQIVRRACSDAREAGVPDEGVRGVYWAVLDYCRTAVESEHRRVRAKEQERSTA